MSRTMWCAVRHGKQKSGSTAGPGAGAAREAEPEGGVHRGDCRQ